MLGSWRTVGADAIEERNAQLLLQGLYVSGNSGLTHIEAVTGL